MKLREDVFNLKATGSIIGPSRIASVVYSRPCWICLHVGSCEHREPEVEQAIMQALATATDRWRKTI